MVLLVVVVLACLVAGPLLFFGRIFTGAVTSGGPENESVPVQEDPGSPRRAIGRPTSSASASPRSRRRAPRAWSR
ncbi:MAG: hypothetical protein R2726_03090 [Acidimicrobiales bacterium]